jgi:integrase
MNRLYNEKVKEEFLSQYDNEQTRKTIRNVFFKTNLLESILEKDLYDFSLEELGKAVANTQPITKNVSRSNGRFISNYISFCIENRYRKNTINPLKGVLPEWYDTFVDKRKLHYSYDEFYELLESLPNGQDQAFLALIWSGVLGEKFSQLTELTHSDIDYENNSVYVKERDEWIPIEKELMKFIEKADNEKTYYQYNMKNGEMSEKQLLSSVYLFKNVKSPRSQEGVPVSMSVLYNRLHSIKQQNELEHLTPISIKQSGQIKMAVDLYQQEGWLAYEQFAKIGTRYQSSQIVNNGYQYYNSHLLREYISEENIKELYFIDVEITKK